MSTVLIGIIVYLVLINVLSFATMGVDKRSAKRHKTRLPEALFFELAGVGGGIGVIIGIFAFHHKINKMWFSLGVPVVIVIQFAISLCIYFAGTH